MVSTLDAFNSCLALQGRDYEKTLAQVGGENNLLFWINLLNNTKSAQLDLGGESDWYLTVGNPEVYFEINLVTNEVKDLWPGWPGGTPNNPETGYGFCPSDLHTLTAIVFEIPYDGGYSGNRDLTKAVFAEVQLRLASVVGPQILFVNDERVVIAAITPSQVIETCGIFGQLVG